MAFLFDGSPHMWSTLASAASYGTAFIYGAWRREYTRLWPIPVLGMVLDSAKEAFFVSNPPVGPGIIWGALIYTLTCMAVCIMGIVFRVIFDQVPAPRSEVEKSRTDGKFPPYEV